jgi:beta-galactosidase
MKFLKLSHIACGIGLFMQAKALPSTSNSSPHQHGRECVSINAGWKFKRWESNPDGVIYDQRPDLENLTDVMTLKPWILPSGNDFIKNPSGRHDLPAELPNINVEYAQNDFDDESWISVDTPHDWAISGPFYTAPDNESIVGGGMGRLPIFGVGWYRRELDISHDDKHRQIYPDIDGAMSYAMVWLNGELIGGWPYPYNSFRLDLTPHLNFSGHNQLAIRLDNPVESARWYPGGGLYRDVWLTKVDRVHVGQWGTRFTSREITLESATVDVEISLENRGESASEVIVLTEVFEVDLDTGISGDQEVARSEKSVTIEPDGKQSIQDSLNIDCPKIWGPPPTQKPHLYLGVTRLVTKEGQEVDKYETRFGVRDLAFTGSDGLQVNGERIRIQGVNEHHDLGAIGAAFNYRAAERKLEILQELGVNAIRMAHNPPASELLELTDKMGFLVVDEIFDSWNLNKTDNDFHLIFSDWHEQDLRSMIRRDRNHPSIISWSFGNEVGEQRFPEELAEIATLLHGIVREEDPTRPSTASMNVAQPGNDGAAFPEIMDVLSINYQGEGIRDTPNYSGTNGTRTPPAYGIFHQDQPEKLIWTSESASALSTRGTFFFPVTDKGGAPVNETSGGNETLAQVSAYELYSANFGSSPDKVFATQDRNPYVGGEFVWTGFDYIGEPTPYYTSRSSYSGIVDLAGFKKERFYLYQARWRPELPMVHILPHWNWPDRVGEVTPVHVFTSGDEAELFLNGKSMGRQRKQPFEYRLRWDDVIYERGELHVVSYKDGNPWANASVLTTGPAAAVRLTADRESISADGRDLLYVTADVVDAEGLIVPTADNLIEISVSGAGQIVATDNGDPADLVAFPSTSRKAFSGRALVILKCAGGDGMIRVSALSVG